MVYIDGLIEFYGCVVDIWQGFFEFVNNFFLVENVFVVEIDEGIYSIGGQGVFVEDFEVDVVEFMVVEQVSVLCSFFLVVWLVFLMFVLLSDVLLVSVCVFLKMIFCIV